MRGRCALGLWELQARPLSSSLCRGSCIHSPFANPNCKFRQMWPLGQSVDLHLCPAVRDSLLSWAVACGGGRAGVAWALGQRGVQWMCGAAGTAEEERRARRVPLEPGRVSAAAEVSTAPQEAQRQGERGVLAGWGGGECGPVSQRLLGRGAGMQTWGAPPGSQPRTSREQEHGFSGRA